MEYRLVSLYGVLVLAAYCWRICSCGVIKASNLFEMIMPEIPQNSMGKLKNLILPSDKRAGK